MLNFCVFTFIGYAVAAIVKMLFFKGIRQQDKEQRCATYLSSTNTQARTTGTKPYLSRYQG